MPNPLQHPVTDAAERARPATNPGALEFDPDPELRYTLRPAAWYALRLRSNQEFRVQRALDGLQIESFLPAWTERVQWADRKKEIVRPLFPGYVFVRSQTREDLLAALRVAGVVQALPDSMKPEPIQDAELETVRRVVSRATHVAPCSYVAGDKVSIESGSLAGIKGVVVRTRGCVHVVVSIELLRRAVKVELDADTLVPAPDGGKEAA
jgi:transcription antitermination factor NusG